MNQVRSEISESPLSRNMARLLGLFLSRVKRKDDYTRRSSLALQARSIKVHTESAQRSCTRERSLFRLKRKKLFPLLYLSIDLYCGEIHHELLCIFLLLRCCIHSLFFPSISPYFSLSLIRYFPFFWFFLCLKSNHS